MKIIPRIDSGKMCISLVNDQSYIFFVPREKRKVQKQRQKLQEKMKLKMIIPGDTKGMEMDMEMFSLANIKSKQVLVEIMSKVRDMSQC